MAKRSSPLAPRPATAPIAAHPPAKNPSLLATSVVLFVLWFVFLLLATLWR